MAAGTCRDRHFAGASQSAEPLASPSEELTKSLGAVRYGLGAQSGLHRRGKIDRPGQQIHIAASQVGQNGAGVFVGTAPEMLDKLVHRLVLRFRCPDNGAEGNESHVRVKLRLPQRPGDQRKVVGARLKILDRHAHQSGQDTAPPVCYFDGQQADLARGPVGRQIRVQVRQFRV